MHFKQILSLSFPSQPSSTVSDRRTSQCRWLALLGPILICGCLVTDPIEESAPKAVQENRPPHIVESSVLPKNWQPIRFRSSVPCSQELAIYLIVDEDIEDNLTAYWYLDKDPEKSAPDFEDPIILSGRPERIGPRWTPENLELGIHIVKVIIRDGSDSKSSISYSWVLDCGGEG